MEAPQQRSEVDPVESQLRLLDDGLRIRWNPTARFHRTSHIDAEGKVISTDEHEGRWQVGKIGLDHADPARFEVIYTLESDLPDDYGAYRPVGDWLVEFFQKWDSQNRAYRDAWEKEWAGHDAILEKGRVWQDESAALEGLDKMFVNMSERHTRYPGRGADFK